MSDAILVLNAGSSSIKFSLFLEHGESLERFLGGQLEGLYTKPRISVEGSRIPVWVIQINEESMIARHTRSILNTIKTGEPHHEH